MKSNISEKSFPWVSWEILRLNDTDRQKTVCCHPKQGMLDWATEVKELIEARPFTWVLRLDRSLSISSMSTFLAYFKRNQIWWTIPGIKCNIYFTGFLHKQIYKLLLVTKKWQKNCFSFHKLIKNSQVLKKNKFCTSKKAKNCGGEKHDPTKGVLVWKWIERLEFCWKWWMLRLVKNYYLNLLEIFCYSVSQLFSFFILEQSSNHHQQYYQFVTDSPQVPYSLSYTFTYAAKLLMSD